MSHDTRILDRSSDREIWPADMRRPLAMNVGETERVASVMGGGVLAVLGMARGGLAGAAMTIVGGALVYRGITGRCMAYSALGLDAAHGECALWGSSS